MVITDTQTAGRGRFGRSWISPPEQNIYMSILLRPDMQPKTSSIITLMSSVACIKAIKRLASIANAHIKWPNDIMLGSKKAGGILTESRIEGAKLSCVVVGIGLNVNMPSSQIPQKTNIPATSILAETGTIINRSELAAAIIQETEKYYLLLKTHGIAAIIDIWTSMTKMIGSQITVCRSEGDISGTAEGLDKEGRLLLRQPNGKLITILSGDVKVTSYD